MKLSGVFFLEHAQKRQVKSRTRTRPQSKALC